MQKKKKKKKKIKKKKKNKEKWKKKVLNMSILFLPLISSSAFNVGIYVAIF